MGTRYENSWPWSKYDYKYCTGTVLVFYAVCVCNPTCILLQFTAFFVQKSGVCHYHVWIFLRYVSESKNLILGTTCSSSRDLQGASCLFSSVDFSTPYTISHTLAYRRSLIRTRACGTEKPPYSVPYQKLNVSCALSFSSTEHTAHTMKRALAAVALTALAVVLIRNSHSGDFTTILTRSESLSDAPPLRQSEFSPPAFNESTYIFNAVHNQLRHVGNAMAPNGMTFTPGFVPPGTVLYHGMNRKELPQDLDWFAFDPEYSFTMCCNIGHAFGNPHITTAQVVEPLKIVYIDGASASLSSDLGTMDSQGFLLDDPIDTWNDYTEFARGDRLCRLFKENGFKLDGFVRMNTGFELLMCNMTNPKVEYVMNNAIAVSEEEGTAGLMKRSSFEVGQTFLSRDRFGNLLVRPSREFNFFDYDWVKSMERTHSSAGEERVELDYRGLVTIYGMEGSRDIDFPKNVSQHRLLTGSEALRQELRSQLWEADKHTRTYDPYRINWRTVTDNLVYKMAPILAQIKNGLGQLEAGTSSLNDTSKHLGGITSMLRLRFEGDEELANSTRHDVDAQVERCAKTYASDFHKYDVTPFEEKVRFAIRLVSTAVCSVIMETADWANKVQTRVGNVSEELPSKLHADVSDLISDLNWSYFVSCTHRCKDNEVCYLPTWPHGGREPHIPAEPLQCRTIEDLRKSRGL